MSFLIGALALVCGLAFLVALCYAISAGKDWKWKLGGASIIIMIPFAPSCSDWWEHRQYEIRYNRVKALFDERCKTAGQKIYQTASAVDGVLLMNVPPDPTEDDYRDPNWVYAGLPGESHGDRYVYSYLYPDAGYKYADVKNTDNTARRHEIIEHPQGSPYASYNKKPVQENIKNPARYAVSLASVVDASGRAHGIAGITATITDTQTHAVMATSTWYSFNPGFESPTKYHPEWGYVAQTCPEPDARHEDIIFFVRQVLIPRREN